MLLLLREVYSLKNGQILYLEKKNNLYKLGDMLWEKMPG